MWPSLNSLFHVFKWGCSLFPSQGSTFQVTLSWNKTSFHSVGTNWFGCSPRHTHLTWTPRLINSGRKCPKTMWTWTRKTLRRFSVLNAGLVAAEVKPTVNIWVIGLSSGQRRVFSQMPVACPRRQEKGALGYGHMWMDRGRLFISWGRDQGVISHLTCWGTKRRKPHPRQHPWASHSIPVSNNGIHTTKHLFEWSLFVHNES